MGMALLVVALATTFLLCAVPFGLVVAKAQGVDVRTVGSGNIGTTNVAREVGKGAAALTLLLDAGKGWLAVFAWSRILSMPGNLALLQASFGIGGLAHDLAPYADSPLSWVGGLLVIAAVCGHVFSPYLHFHGGKGIAVGFGASLGLMPPVALSVLVVFLILAVGSKRVSLGSVAAAATLPVFTWLFYCGPEAGERALSRPPVPAVIEMAACAAVVIWAHRSNIDKLAHGSERAFSFHKKGAPTDRLGS